LTSPEPIHLSDETGPSPTRDDLPRRFADFDTLVEAVEYAAQGVRGLNFYSVRGGLGPVVSYRELRDWARDVGGKLIALGFQPGERLALLAATQPAFVAFFLGCQYAGVLPVPLPLPTSFGGRDSYVGQLARQLEHCAASGLLGPQSMLELAEQAAQGQNLRFTASFEGFDDAAPAPSQELYIPAGDDLAYLQYSSGSTRFPHGIAIPHSAVMANCSAQGEAAMQLVPDDRAVSWLPFYHDMGLVGMLLTPLTNQVSADYLATEDFARRPLEWLKLMSHNAGTIAYAPTFGYDICARRIGREQAERLDLSPWRVAGIGGDMIRPEVMRRFAEALAPAGFKPTTFVPSYGLAECTLAVSIAPIGRGMEVDLVDERILSGARGGKVEPQNDHGVNGAELDGAGGVKLKHHEESGLRRREVVNCGLPLPGVEVQVRDEDGRVLGEREIGRFFVRGPSVMRGYFGDEETNRRVLSQDGWLDTGDMGYLREGCLYVVGRAKDMIIVNGRNHWPQDIEWAVEQLDGVRSGDAAAVSLPGADGQEVPTLLVQCRVREPEEQESLIEKVRRQVLRVTGIQCRVELVPARSLPRTSSGKLSRSKARQQFLEGQMPAVTG